MVGGWSPIGFHESEVKVGGDGHHRACPSTLDGEEMRRHYNEPLVTPFSTYRYVL